MQLRGGRFTIRTLMIAVLVVAGILGIARWTGWPLLIVGAEYFALAPVFWLKFRRYRRVSAIAFGILVVLTNLACIALNLFLHGMSGVFFGLACCVLNLPLCLGIGAGWATAASRTYRRRWEMSLLTWSLVILASILPLVTTLSHWPFRLAFLFAEPELNRMADAVAVGNAITRPTRAGMFLVLGSSIDPASRNIGFITDINPNGNSGFVRSKHVDRFDKNRYTPFTNLSFSLDLSDDWSYACEE